MNLFRWLCWLVLLAWVGRSRECCGWSKWPIGPTAWNDWARAVCTSAQRDGPWAWELTRLQGCRVEGKIVFISSSLALCLWFNVGHMDISLSVMFMMSIASLSYQNWGITQTCPFFMLYTIHLFLYYSNILSLCTATLATTFLYLVF